MDNFPAGQAHDAKHEQGALLSIGDPFDPTTQVGPIATREQHAKVSGFIEQARRDGARCVLGGNAVRPAHCGAGWYVEPTLFVNVDPDATIDDYERIMAVNLRGVFLGTKHAIRTMVPTGGGAIVNWSSAGGLNAPTLPVSVYNASKAGVISFTKAAAIEYGGKGIRANALCPGFVESEMSGGPGSAERFPQVIAGQAIKRGAHPDEIAEVASFLASDRASFMTGAIVAVDGGQSARLA